MPRSTVPAELATVPFTRRQALAAGLTDRQLPSSAWRQVFNRVWVAAEVEDTRELRLAAARLLLPPVGVLCGLTAAWAFDVDVRRLDDLDVHAGFPKGKRVRKRAGLAVRHETLDPSDIADVGGMPVTTPVRTAFDCLRWLRVAEGLVVADALMHTEHVMLEELQRYFRTKHRLRNL